MAKGGGASSLTWPVEELALAHVGDVQTLEQQHQVTQVLLHHAGAAECTHALLIEGLGVQADAHACHRVRLGLGLGLGLVIK